MKSGFFVEVLAGEAEIEDEQRAIAINVFIGDVVANASLLSGITDIGALDAEYGRYELRRGGRDRQS